MKRTSLTSGDQRKMWPIRKRKKKGARGGGKKYCVQARSKEKGLFGRNQKTAVDKKKTHGEGGNAKGVRTVKKKKLKETKGDQAIPLGEKEKTTNERGPGLTLEVLQKEKGPKLCLSVKK